MYILNINVKSKCKYKYMGIQLTVKVNPYWTWRQCCMFIFLLLMCYCVIIVVLILLYSELLVFRDSFFHHELQVISNYFITYYYSSLCPSSVAWDQTEWCCGLGWWMMLCIVWTEESPNDVVSRHFANILLNLKK